MAKYDSINIEAMSDEEFLSWLYLERNREEDIKKNVGWNNWLLGGSLFALISYVYFHYSGCWQSDIINNIVAFTSMVFGYIIGILPSFIIFKKHRAYNNKRVRKLWDEAPILFLSCELLIALIYIILFAIFHEKRTVLVMWILLFICFLIELVYLMINSERVVVAWDKSSTFVNINQQKIMTYIKSLLGFFIGNHSLLCIEDLNRYEFEISTIVIIILIESYWLLKLNILKIFGSEDIDEIIDNVTYNGMSKKRAYRKIQIIRLGYRPVDYLWDHLELIDSLKDKTLIISKGLDEIKLSLEKNEITPHIVKTAFEYVDKSVRLQNKIIAEEKSLMSKVKDIINQKTPLLDSDFIVFVKDMEDYFVNLDDFVKTTKETIANIKNIIHFYCCKRYGGFCGNMDCPKRNKPMPIITKIFFYFKYYRKK